MPDAIRLLTGLDAKAVGLEQFDWPEVGHFECPSERVQDQLETPSTITLKRASTIAEIRTWRKCRLHARRLVGASLRSTNTRRRCIPVQTAWSSIPHQGVCGRPDHSSWRSGKRHLAGSSRLTIFSLFSGRDKSMICGSIRRFNLVEKNTLTHGVVSDLEV